MNAPDLDRRLASLDRTQLQELVRRLVDRHPDLVDLVQLPLTGEKARVDPASIRGHVHRVLRGMGDDWRASYRAQFELDPIVTIGQDYEKAGALSEAREVYRAVIDGILDLYEQIRDEESEIVNVVGDCLDGLGRCLAATTDVARRQQLLDDVLHVFVWDAVQRGSFGMDGFASKVLLAEAQLEERAWLVRRLLDALAMSTRTWGRRTAGELMVALLGDQPAPADLEAVLSAAGLVRPLAELLLGQGRVDETVALLAGHDRAELAVASLLCAAGRRDEVVERVRGHALLLDPRDDSVRDWLRAHDVPTDGLEELAWEVSRFGGNPTISGWKQLRVDATRIGWWDRTAEALVRLADREGTKVQPVRARALAAVGRWTEAMTVFAAMTDSARWTAALEMAEDAEAQGLPEMAVPLYRAAIPRLRAGNTASRARAREVAARVDRMAGGQ